MECPNCKKELMNINGRNICVECGTEVPDSQMDNLVDSMPSFSAPTPDVPNVPETVANDTPNVINDISAETATAVENNVEVSTVLPETENTSETFTEGLSSENTLQTPIEVEDSAQTAEGEPTIEQIQETEPVLTEPEPVDETEMPEINIGNQSPQVDSLSTAVPEETQVQSIPEEPTEIPGIETETQPEVQVESTQADEPVVTESTETSPVSEIPQPEIPAVPEPTVEQQIPVEAPVESVSVEQPNEVVETSAEPVDMFANTETPSFSGVDQNVYQNPMFDGNDGPTEPPVTQSVASVSNIEYMDVKKIIAMLAIGFILLVIFIVGGFAAYKYLTAPTPLP